MITRRQTLLGMGAATLALPWQAALAYGWIGLVLLLVLTLLAVTGMNTASSELLMAGNEQFRQNAFQASEAGIERALSALPTIPQSGTPVVLANQPVPGSTSDEFTTSSRYVGDDLNLPGFSAGKFVGFHYEITSTGTSARNARSEERRVGKEC